VRLFGEIPEGGHPKAVNPDIRATILY
jgi:hypothetical protein